MLRRARRVRRISNSNKKRRSNAKLGVSLARYLSREGIVVGILQFIWFPEADLVLIAVVFEHKCLYIDFIHGAVGFHIAFCFYSISLTVGLRVSLEILQSIFVILQMANSSATPATSLLEFAARSFQ